MKLPQNFMQHEDVLSCSQQSIIDPHAEPHETNPRPPVLFLKDPFQHYTVLYDLVFLLTLLLFPFQGLLPNNGVKYLPN
jgi:hypothetical protein